MASSTGGFSLGWIDYAINFSNSLKDLLQKKELTDVTLVADGHLFNAHRLVLSALSPYFQQIFAQMPANQQAYVFLKDVPKETLDDLITYIYSGKVNVKQEHLEEFFDTAEALNIKGLADGGYTHSTNISSSFSNSFKPKFDGMQYQSSCTTRIPDQVKPNYGEPIHFESLTNALYQHREYFENEATNELNENGDDYSNSYDYEYDESEFGLGDSLDSNHGTQADESNINHTYGVQEQQAKPNVIKRAKRTRLNLNNDPSEYNTVADIQAISNGRENLFHNEHKFYKSNRPNLSGQQRWACTKRKNTQCRAAMSTMQVDGVVMMKVLVAEHTHSE